MKKLLKQHFLYALLFLELVTTSMASAFPLQTAVGENHGTFVMKPKITISFTIARRRDCEGFGICDWTATVSSRANYCSGTLQADENDRYVYLEVIKDKGVSAEGYLKYFSSGFFILEDASPVPADITRSLGIPSGSTIAAGKYLVTEQKGILRVALQIENK